MKLKISKKWCIASAKKEGNACVGAGLPSVLGLSKISAPSKRVGSGRLVSRKALVHGIAHCGVCGWGCEDYLTVQNKAAEHARRTGHKVSCDLGYFVCYGG